MKKRKYLLLLSLLFISCTNTPNNVTPSVSPSANSSLLPSSSVSATPNPVSSITATPSSSPTITPIATPISTAIPTSTPTPTPVLEPKSQIELKNAFIKTPNSSFLVQKDLELKIKLSLDSFPAQNKIFSILDLFDNDATDKRSHLSLYLDSSNNLALNVNTKNLSLSDIKKATFQQGINYELLLIKKDNVVKLLIDGTQIISLNVNDDDFDDFLGRRTLNIGANSNGDNRGSFKLDLVDVKGFISYDFKNSFVDSSKYKQTADVVGDYSFIVDPVATPTPTATPDPNVTPTPTPSVSYSPVPERQVTTISDTIILDLNVYNFKNVQKYADCVKRKDADQKKLDDEAKKTNSTPLKTDIDCSKEVGTYVTQDFELATKQTLNNGVVGDIKFISVVDFFGYDIRIAGRDSEPKVTIVDIGEKQYEGIDLPYLQNKVDYENKNRIFSTSNYSTLFKVDHVYAIKSFRYGQAPHYAKLRAVNILTEDFVSERLQAPEIVSQPQFVNANKSTNLQNNTDYTYSVSTYDGIGETLPSQFNVLSGSAQANQSQVEFKFKTPYNSKGYVVYRKDNSNSKISKIGPFLALPLSEITYKDFGNKGIFIDSLPSTNTTKRSAFKPNADSRLDRVEFDYKFYGDEGL